MRCTWSRAGVAILSITCVGIGAHTADSQASKIELQKIEAAIEAAGPAQALKSYFDCDSGKGYSLVASGDQRAVDIAFRLLPTADACFSEQLRSALATALANNPQTVLQHYAQSTEFEKFHAQFCVPFMDAESTSKDAALKTLQRTQQSLERVTQVNLQQVKQACLADIGRDIQRLSQR